jgi:predicted PurR-regulated permease PerM
MAIDPGSKTSGADLSSSAPEQHTRRAARLVLSLGLWLLGIWMMRGLLVPLVWATILAFVTWPLYRRFVRSLSRLGQDRITPIAFTLLAGLIFLIPLALVAVEVARDAPNLERWLVSIKGNGVAAPDWAARIPIVGNYLYDWWKANLSDPHAAAELLKLNRGAFVYWIRSLGTQLLYRLTDLLFTLLTLFFLYRHGARFALQLQALGDVPNELMATY